MKRMVAIECPFEKYNPIWSNTYKTECGGVREGKTEKKACLCASDIPRKGERSNRMRAGRNLSSRRLFRIVMTSRVGRGVLCEDVVDVNGDIDIGCIVEQDTDYTFRYVGMPEKNRVPYGGGVNE